MLWSVFSGLVEAVLSKRNDYDEELANVEKTIDFFLQTNSQFSQLHPFILNQGKRIRSILYFLNWRSVTEQKSTIAQKSTAERRFIAEHKSIKEAAAERQQSAAKQSDFLGNSRPIDLDLKYRTIALIEIIHFASLLHDDVIDNNAIRRNSASFFRKFGAKKSIVIGDLLIVKALGEFLALHSQNSIVKNLCLRECSAMAYGATLERNLTITSSFQDCLRVSALKTASLFKLACFLGNFLSSNDFSAAKSKAFLGLCFGIIFQFANDLESYTSDDCRFSEDFSQKNITLPLMLLRDHCDFSLSKFLSSEQKDYDEIRRKIQTHDFQTAAQQRLSKFLTPVIELLHS